MKKYRFRMHDHVRIRPECRWWYEDFAESPEQADAVVVEKDEEFPQYGLFVRGNGECAWFEENDLELVGRNARKLLARWERELDERIGRESDLDWIFQQAKEHGPSWEIPNASIVALHNCLSSGDMCGRCGEGLVWLLNAVATLNLAKPFLVSGDKVGWLEYAKRTRAGIV